MSTEINRLVQHHYSLLQAAQKREGPTDMTHLKSKVLQMLSGIVTQVRLCNDVDGLLHAQKHIQIASNACKAISSSSSTKMCTMQRFQERGSSEPANKKIIQQRPFKSTKMKTKPPTIKLAKPTQKDKELVLYLLSGQERMKFMNPQTAISNVTSKIIDKNERNIHK